MAVVAHAIALLCAASLICGAGVARAEADAERETPLPWLEEGTSTPGWDVGDALQLDPVQPRDPRVARADSYLADRDTYDEAIELYRSYLAEHPEDEAVRLRLARVSAWRGNLGEAIVEYDAIAHESALPIVHVERAEVLSWAGRYRDAEAAFRAILERDEKNARAARGLARVFLWSGRSYEADRAYMRALEMADDSEARSEWEGLHALYRPQIGTRVSRRSDNDDYFFQSIESDGTAYVDLRTRLSGEIAYWRTRGEVDLGGGQRDRRDRDGVAYGLGVERHLNQSWLTRFRIGHEAWDGARDQLAISTEVRFTPFDSTSATFGYEHSGAGRPLESFDAIEEGIRRDELSLALWQDLLGPFELWGQAAGGWLSDSNARFRSDLSLSYKPFEEHELRFHLSNATLQYAEDSDLYYDPDLDIDNQLSADYVQPLFLGLRIRVETAIGYGVSRESGVTSDGVVFRTGSFLWWEWRRWGLEVGGSFSQSRRSNAYRSHHVTAALKRSF